MESINVAGVLQEEGDVDPRSLVWLKISNIDFAVFHWSKGYIISDERSTKFM